jgi:putative redox protein
LKTKIRLVEGMTFLGESESGHAVVMDARPEFGGRNLGPSPMEMTLMGMGGCTSIDVVSILRKARQDVQGCEAEVNAEKASDYPTVFTKIHVHFVVTGRGLSPKKVQNAIDLSAHKYCSVSIMLGKTAEITHDFEIVEV